MRASVLSLFVCVTCVAARSPDVQAESLPLATCQGQWNSLALAGQFGANHKLVAVSGTLRESVNFQRDSSTWSSRALSGQVALLVQGKDGWMLTIEKVQSTPPGSSNLPTTSSILLSQREKTGEVILPIGRFSNCRFEHLDVLQKALPAKEPCTSERVRSVFLPEAQQFSSAKDATAAAQLLCELRQDTQAAQAALDRATANFLLDSFDRATSSSVLTALVDVPAAAARLNEECRKVLLATDTTHSFAAALAPDRINATCLSSVASLFDNLARESTSWCRDQCQGLLRQ
jgi:hypothetical protein